MKTDSSYYQTIIIKTNRNMINRRLQCGAKCPITLQETVTGRTLDGREEDLEFLNFANEWTPSKMMLQQDGYKGNQSASKEKKRKGTEDGGTSSAIPFSASWEPSEAGRATQSTNFTYTNRSTLPYSEDFSPHVKRLCVQQPRGFRRKRMSRAGWVAPLMAWQQLFEPGPVTEPGSCSTCTYSNSTLPRSSSSAVTSGTIRNEKQIITNHPLLVCVCACAHVLPYFLFLLMRQLHFADCKTNWTPLRKRQ